MITRSSRLCLCDTIRDEDTFEIWKETTIVVHDNATNKNSINASRKNDDTVIDECAFDKVYLILIKGNI